MERQFVAPLHLVKSTLCRRRALLYEPLLSHTQRVAFFATGGDVQGDVTDAASVTAAMAGCCKCVACFGAQRLTKLSDLWTESTQDPAHPYQINYMGVANLVEAAKATPGFQKIVRVTGLSVGYSAFDKIAVLLNLVLSLTIRYQTMGERAIRDSGIDYTVIRPGNMKEPRPEGAQLRLSAGTGVHNHPVGKVLRQVRSIRSQPWPVAKQTRTSTLGAHCTAHVRRCARALAGARSRRVLW